ncbi:MAG: hypothetical protein ACI9LT_002035 [Pseudoalteromonas distincta]|jgi:hypothetical protein
MSTVTVYHSICLAGGAPASANRLATREAIEALPGAERMLCTGIAVGATTVENGFLRADYDWTEGSEPASDPKPGQ